MLTAEAKYPINFTQSGKILALNRHYSGSNILLFVNATKLYKFKEKFFERDYNFLLLLILTLLIQIIF